eukprot:RCo036152
MASNTEAEKLDVELPTHVNGLPLEDVYEAITEFARMLQSEEENSIRDVLLTHPALSVAMVIVLQQAGVLRNAKMDLIPHPFHEAAEEKVGELESADEALKNDILQQLAQVPPDQLRDLLSLTPEMMQALSETDRQNVLQIQRVLGSLATQL